VENGIAVSGIGFVGLRTEKFVETLALFRDVIGVALTRHADGLAGFSLDDGTVLEVYERGETFHESASRSNVSTRRERR
jgi:hypothetical protein